MLDFVERRKTVEPEEEPLEQSENQQQTQLTYGTGQESNLGHINGRQLLSPALHKALVVQSVIKLILDHMNVTTLLRKTRQVNVFFFVL